MSITFEDQLKWYDECFENFCISHPGGNQNKYWLKQMETARENLLERVRELENEVERLKKPELF